MIQYIPHSCYNLCDILYLTPIGGWGIRNFETYHFLRIEWFLIAVQRPHEHPQSRLKLMDHFQSVDDMTSQSPQLLKYILTVVSFFFEINSYVFYYKKISAENCEDFS